MSIELRRSRGVVLIVALFMLLIITALSATMMTQVGLNKRVSGNYLSKSAAFEVANSAVRHEWSSLPITGSGETITEARTRDLLDRFDVSSEGAIYSASVQICYLGSGTALGTDEDYEAHLFRMTSDITDGSGTRSSVEQSGYILAERTDLVIPGSC